MTEDEAQDWIVLHHGVEAYSRLGHLCKIVRKETVHQNLIAPSTIAQIWSRHIVDSAQLLPLVPDDASASWLDIGTGGGFPGLVIALLSARPITLLEPRRKRADFLHDVVAQLGVAKHTMVACRAVETYAETAAIISARAVAPMDKLFEIAGQCARAETRWILPRGRSAEAELAQTRLAWHGVFHVERSITDPGSLIVVASEVSPR